MTPIHPAAARGFEAAADAYDRGRPGYPEEAVAHLMEALRIGPGATVLDLGAGTGKLTAMLAPAGASLVAVEPVDAMRATLERWVPHARALAGTAEAIPLEDASVDAVVVAQAFDRTSAFGPLRVQRFPFRHRTTPDGLVDRVLSTSFIGALGPEERAIVRERVLELTRTHPQLAGRDHFDFPYVTEVWWCATRRR